MPPSSSPSTPHSPALYPSTPSATPHPRSRTASGLSAAPAPAPPAADFSASDRHLPIARAERQHEMHRRPPNALQLLFDLFILERHVPQRPPSILCMFVADPDGSSD